MGRLPDEELEEDDEVLVPPLLLELLVPPLLLELLELVSTAPLDEDVDDVDEPGRLASSI